MRKYIVYSLMILFSFTAVTSCKKAEYFDEAQKVEPKAGVTLYNLSSVSGVSINYFYDNIINRYYTLNKFHLGFWNSGSGLYPRSPFVYVQPGNPIAIPESAFVNDTAYLKFVETNIIVKDTFITQPSVAKDVYYFSLGNSIRIGTTNTYEQTIKVFPHVTTAPSQGKFKIRLLNLDYGDRFSANPRLTPANFCNLQLADGTPLISDVPLGERSDFIELPHGTYKLLVTDNLGSKRAIYLGSGDPTDWMYDVAVRDPQHFKPGGVYTVVARSARDLDFQHYRTFDIIQDKVYAQEEQANAFLVNALPGSTGLTLSAGSTSTELVGYAGYSTTIGIRSGSQRFEIKQNGQRLLDTTVYVSPYTNLMLSVYEKNGKPALLVVNNDLSFSFVGGVKTRYLNLTADAPYITFTDHNDVIVDTAYAAALPIGLPEFWKDDKKNRYSPWLWYDRYGMFYDMAHWVWVPESLKVYQMNNAGAPLPGTPVPGAEINTPFITNPVIAGSAPYESGIYTAILIGRVNTSNAAEAARILIIKHLK